MAKYRRHIRSNFHKISDFWNSQVEFVFVHLDVQCEGSPTAVSEVTGRDMWRSPKFYIGEGGVLRQGMISSVIIATDHAIRHSIQYG